MVQDLATQWLQSFPCKSKTSQEIQKSLMKFLEPTWKPTVIHTDQNLAKLVKTYCGIIVRQHHAVQKLIGLRRERYADLRKGHLRYCCNQVWMKSGGQIPWGAAAICETYKISCLMGKLRTRDASENHLKDQSFRLVHWSNITLFLPKTCRDCISSASKFYQAYS